MSTSVTANDTLDLFERSVATLIRSWAYLAGGSPGAEVIEAEGAAIAAFVHAPNRKFLNNALLPHGATDLGPALEAIERVYAERGIGAPRGMAA